MTETRTCSHCEKEMVEGYVFDGGSDYYCSETCLSTVVTPKQWDELYKEDPDYFYWTTWY